LRLSSLKSIPLDGRHRVRTFSGSPMIKTVLLTLSWLLADGVAADELKKLD
jgi:hypothetical protein